MTLAPLTQETFDSAPEYSRIIPLKVYSASVGYSLTSYKGGSEIITLNMKRTTSDTYVVDVSYSRSLDAYQTTWGGGFIVLP